MRTTSDIREPAVAGFFYPGDPRQLAGVVDELTNTATPDPPTTPARMLLAPHAGYPYSGAIAGRGFQRVRAAGTPSRTFIISPSHVEAFAFTSVYHGAAYRTPLGEVGVDVQAAAGLVESDPSIQLSDAGHQVSGYERGEHGIEVELPFLQRCFPDSTIVPIVMGVQSWEACEALGRAIAAIADWNHDLVLASSDLSHFYTDRKARELDGVFCETLMTADAKLLHARLSRRECEACGGGPVVAALIATSSLRTRSAELLASGNSSDAGGDRSSVVGYASAVVTGDPA